MKAISPIFKAKTALKDGQPNRHLMQNETGNIYLEQDFSTSELLLFVVQSLSHIQLFATPRTAAPQSPLSFTISLSLLKHLSIESAILYNHLILCRPLLLLPSIFPSTRVFSNGSGLHIRWPKYWCFSFIWGQTMFSGRKIPCAL